MNQDLLASEVFMSITVRDYLLACSKEGKVVTYNSLLTKFKLNPQQLKNILNEITIDCIKNGEELLSFLVVTPSTDLPKLNALSIIKTFENDNTGFSGLEDYNINNFYKVYNNYKYRSGQIESSIGDYTESKDIELSIETSLLNFLHIRAKKFFRSNYEKQSKPFLHSSFSEDTAREYFKFGYDYYFKTDSTGVINLFILKDKWIQETDNFFSQEVKLNSSQVYKAYIEEKKINYKVKEQLCIEPVTESVLFSQVVPEFLLFD